MAAPIAGVAAPEAMKPNVTEPLGAIVVLYGAGVTVTEPLGGAVRRTCYQYDKMGNRIGAREPKAAMTSCN